MEWSDIWSQTWPNLAIYAADMAFDRRSGQILVAGMAKSIYLYAAVVAFDRMVNRSVADRARVDFVRAT